MERHVDSRFGVLFFSLFTLFTFISISKYICVVTHGKNMPNIWNWIFNQQERYVKGIRLERPRRKRCKTRTQTKNLNCNYLSCDQRELATLFSLQSRVCIAVLPAYFVSRVLFCVRSFIGAAFAVRLCKRSTYMVCDSHCCNYLSGKFTENVYLLKISINWVNNLHSCSSSIWSFQVVGASLLKCHALKCMSARASKLWPIFSGA